MSPTVKVVKEMDNSKNSEKDDVLFCIDKRMWRFKLHFFLFIGGIAAVFPFVPDYSKEEIGISTSSLAVILFVQQFLIIVTKPAIGYIADYLNKLKALICFLTILQGFCFLLLLLIPKIHTVGTLPSYSWTQCWLENNDTSLTNGGIAAFEFHGNLSQVDLLRLEKCQSSMPTPVSIDIPSRIQCSEVDGSIYSSQQDCKCVCQVEKEHCLCLLTAEEIAHFTENVQQCWCYEKETLSRLGSRVKHVNDFSTYQFWIFAFLYTVAMVCNNGIFTLADTACCESVEKAGAQFGRQRLWGGIGWGLIAPVAGLLKDYTRSYLPSWLLMEVFMMITVWNVSQLDLQKPAFSKNILRDVGTVFKSGEFLTFELGLLMNGIGSAIVWYYLVLYLISIGASKMLCGLSLTIQSFLGTLPLMYFSSKIIKKMGHLNVVSLALLMYTVRFAWYAYLQDPWWVLLVECLHGLTYALLYTNIASFGKESSRPGTEATTQSVLFSTHEGIGGGIGCVLGGLAVDHVGGHQLFFIATIFAGCSFFLHQICVQLVRRKKGSMKVKPIS